MNRKESSAVKTFDFFEIFQMLWAGRWVFLLTVLAVIAAGLFLYLNQTKMHMVSVTLQPAKAAQIQEINRFPNHNSQYLNSLLERKSPTQILDELYLLMDRPSVFASFVASNEVAAEVFHFDENEVLNSQTQNPFLIERFDLEGIRTIKVTASSQDARIEEILLGYLEFAQQIHQDSYFEAFHAGVKANINNLNFMRGIETSHKLTMIDGLLDYLSSFDSAKKLSVPADSQSNSRVRFATITAPFDLYAESSIFAVMNYLALNEANGIDKTIAIGHLAGLLEQLRENPTLLESYEARLAWKILQSVSFDKKKLVSFSILKTEQNFQRDASLLRTVFRSMTVGILLGLGLALLRSFRSRVHS